jgi:outer membrane protein OmpA-like peptidoglycan-associated protein
MEAEDRDGFSDADGCPDLDDDNDGILDQEDRCRNAPEDLDGFQDHDGCPDPDDDGDGIADGSDLCPRQPETRNHYRDSDGCPDQIPDRDGDGVVDADDRCPEVAGDPQLGGCVQPRVSRQDTERRLPAAIRFSLGGARLGPEADQSLAELAQLIVETPELKVLSIRGHSSSDGKPAANMKLSNERANAVLNALVMLGVEPSRLRAKGLGSSHPIADDGTVSGRSANRRVDFEIAEWQEPAASSPPPR